jgi:amidophosphoribosyltransferase
LGVNTGEKGPQDACGVFGVWAPGEEVAKLTYFGLYALQHRGQESAGIAVSNGSQILVFKDMGLVSQVFDETSLGSLQGHIAVGHARYSTTGASVWENAQPTFRATAHGSIALGHNGNLVNTAQLAEMVADLPKKEGRSTRVERPSFFGMSATISASFAVLTRLPLWPSAMEPWAVALNVGCAFSHTDAPVVE